MKKTIITVFSAAAAASIVISATAENDISVTVNGSDVVFDQPPVIENDRTLVPMRAIFEALGAEVEWDGEARKVTSTKGDIKISLAIDSTEMSVGERNVTLDVPAKIINDRTMVPVRAISEAMECKVDWDGGERKVIITTDINPTATAVPEITAAPEATAAPEGTPSPAVTEVPFAEPIKTEIADDVNVFDLAWIVPKTEITAADGKEKANEKLIAEKAK